MIERGIRDWRDPIPPTNLTAFRNSLMNRIAQHLRAQEGGGVAKPIGGADGGRLIQANPDEKWGTWAEYAPRLRSFGRGADWLSSWGEPPGHRMCQIPKRMIVEILGAERAAELGIVLKGAST